MKPIIPLVYGNQEISQTEERLTKKHCTGPPWPNGIRNRRKPRLGEKPDYNVAWGSWSQWHPGDMRFGNFPLSFGNPFLLHLPPHMRFGNCGVGEVEKCPRTSIGRELNFELPGYQNLLVLD